MNIFTTAYAYNSVALNSTTAPIFQNTTDPGDLVLLIISVFVLVSGVLSIMFILWWGLLMILSGWKEDKIKPALNTIRYAILWIIITVITIFLFPILWRLLWIDVEKYAKPQRIFEKIEELWNNIFWSGNNSVIITNSRNDELPSDFTTDL